MNRFIRYTYPRSANSLFANRNPWSGLESEVSRLFDSALTDYAGAAAARFPVDLYDDKENSYVRAELPGVAREAISLEVVDGYLNIEVSTKAESEQSAVTYSRSVAIPEGVQADKVAAAYENGVLTVTLPKQEQAKPRKITVAVN
jgi:HSP20 family protein